MDRVWKTINGMKTLIALVVALLSGTIAGALYLKSMETEIDRINRYGTDAHENSMRELQGALREQEQRLRGAQEEQERRLQRLERNVIRLGDRWGVAMEEPPPTER